MTGWAILPRDGNDLAGEVMRLHAVTALVLAGCAVLVSPAWAQGAPGMGAGSIALQPRVGPATNAPVWTPLSRPQQMGPAASAPTGGSSSTSAVTSSGGRALPAAQDQGVIFERWGEQFPGPETGTSAGKGTPVAGADVGLSTGAKGGALHLKADDNGLFPLEYGNFPLGGALAASGPTHAPLTVVFITLPTVQSSTLGATPQAVLVSLLLPAVHEEKEAGRMVQVGHVFDHGLAKAMLTVRRNGDQATVDWGDGSASTDVAREGKPVPVSSAAEAMGRVALVDGPKP